MSRLAAVLLVSLAAHAGLLFGVVATLGFVTPRMLFVDLVEGFGLTAGYGSGGGGSAGEPGAFKTRDVAARASTTAGIPSRPSAARATRREPSPAWRAQADVVLPPRDEAAPAPARPPSDIEEPRTVPEPPRATLDPLPVTPPLTAFQTATATPTVAAPTPGATEPSSAGRGGTGASDAPGGEGGRESGVRAGQGGSGGGLGAGVGTGHGSVVARTVPGDGGAALADYERYYALLRSRLHAALKYPGTARRRGLSGTVEIEVHVAPSGEIQRALVVASSTHRVLDDAALDAAHGLRVPFPPGLPPATLRMRLPVVFDLRDQP